MEESRFAKLLEAVQAGRVDPEDGNPGISELLGKFEAGEVSTFELDHIFEEVAKQSLAADFDHQGIYDHQKCDSTAKALFKDIRGLKVEERETLLRCFRGFLHKSQYRLKKGDVPGHQRAERVARLILRIGQDVGRDDDLVPHVEARQPKLKIGPVFEEENPKNALHVAAMCRCPSLIAGILHLIPETSDREAILLSTCDMGKTALHYAMDSVDVTSAMLLIEAEPKLLKKTWDIQGEKRSPLHTLVLSMTSSPQTKWKSMDSAKRIAAIIARHDSNCLERSNHGSKDLTPYAFARSEGCKALQDEFELLIFRYLKDTAALRTALDVKREDSRIFDLDLSDFHRITSNGHEGSFFNFIRDFKKRGDLKFNRSLLRLVLPDLTLNPDPLFTQGLELLSDKLCSDINKITELTAYDHLVAPVRDVTVALLVVMFEVEVLNWRKLDLDLHALKEPCRFISRQGQAYGRLAAQSTRPEPQRKILRALAEQYNLKAQACAEASLREIWLYSSGNKAVLYHWTSVDGLASFEHLEAATIVLENEAESIEEAYEYGKLKGWLSDQFMNAKEELKDKGHESQCELTVLLQPPHRFRAGLKQEPQDFVAQYFKTFTPLRATLRGVPDPVKVAIIDNGLDIWTRPGEEIRGKSFVMSEGIGNTNAKSYLPWFTASHAHGTQLASVIKDINPSVELIMFRISTSQYDVNEDNAVKAIREACLMGADIINISWTIPSENKPQKLWEAVKTVAAENPDDLNTTDANKALLFCAHFDEQRTFDRVWPADFSETISVAAANIAGRPLSYRNADLLLLGESIPTVGPRYMPRHTHMSGSSVATAVATGIASVLLTYNKIYAKEDWAEFKCRARMMNLFGRMQNGGKYVDPEILFKHFANGGQPEKEGYAAPFHFSG